MQTRTMCAPFAVTAMEVAIALWKAMDTPLARKLLSLAERGEWAEVVTTKVNPHDYSDWEAYLLDASAVGFVKKLDGLPTGLDLEQKAIQDFFLSERDCYYANERLSPFLFGAFSGPSDEAIFSILEKARKIVRRILGHDPSDKAFEFCRFGPGSTMSDGSAYSTVPDKMSSRPTITRHSEHVVGHWVNTQWAAAVRETNPSKDLASLVDLVPGNRFFTVPKSSTSLRGCGLEPSVNVFYQLGYGRLIRKQLAKEVPNLSVGIDLDEARTLHMLRACEASVTGAYATIDLSRASDTLSKNLVKFLLPEPWHDHLDGVRSRSTQVDGKNVLLEKFSSMGNGFTFELETLIFLALSKALDAEDKYLIGQDILCFGDDIIVPTELSQDLMWLLRFCGFTPSPEKSFTSGPFRESCGGDFFCGRAVRPYYQKKEPNEPQEIISMVNGIRRLYRLFSRDSRHFHRIRGVWLRTIRLLPSDIRACRGPEDLGDLVIHDDGDHWSTRWRWNANYQRMICYVRVYRPARYKLIRWDGFSYAVQFATALYFDQSQSSAFKHRPLAGRPVDSGRNLIPRDGVSGYKVGWTPVSFRVLGGLTTFFET